MTRAKSKTQPLVPARRPRRRARRRGRGTLVIIASLLFASALIRMGHDAGQAFARGEIPTLATDIKDPVATAQSCEPAPDIAAMLDAFRAREDRLKAKESQIADRMQALSVADREIEKKLAALTDAEANLRKTLALADTAAEDDLTRLTAVYENMKPKQAAALFEAMDPQFAAGFLGRMRPEAAAGVMAGLSPGTAYSVSVILAGRNADVPKD